MDDLVQFLRDRLTEDEQTARAATAGPWRDDGGYVTDVGPGGLPNVQVTDYGTQDDEDGEDGGPQGCADSAHIARHDPARVLAEVDAKRQALDACVYFLNDGEDGPDPCATAVLAALALPYADRPDYRQEWSRDS